MTSSVASFYQGLTCRNICVEICVEVDMLEGRMGIVLFLFSLYIQPKRIPFAASVRITSDNFSFITLNCFCVIVEPFVMIHCVK